MKTNLDKEENFKHKLFWLLVISFIIRFAFLHVHPLYLDECLYSEMTEEMMQKPSLVPTYIGYDTSWKPPFFFWIYSIFVNMFKLFTNDIELIYKLPNILLGVLNVWLVFIVFKKITDEQKAFYTCVLYALCSLVIYTDLRVLLDTMNTMLIFISFYFYFDKPNTKNIVAGALFAFLAAITKSVVAFLIPLVVFVHFWKKETNIKVIISLATVPIGIILCYFTLLHFTPQLADKEFMLDIIGKIVKEESKYINDFFSSFTNMFVFVHVLFIFAVFGLTKFWKENAAMTMWFACMIFPLIGSSGMIWYFEPFIPILAYFCVRALAFDSITESSRVCGSLGVNPKKSALFSKERWLPPKTILSKASGSFSFAERIENNKTVFRIGSWRFTKTEKFDSFFKLAIAGIIIFNLIICIIWYYLFTANMLVDERTIGYALVGKENVAFIGDYRNSITALSYKILEERMRYGKYNDFGWVIISQNSVIANKIKMIPDFAINYHTEKYIVNEKNIAQLFWNDEIFRKQTNITKFDYLVISISNTNLTGEWANFTIQGYEKITKNNNTNLFKRISTY